MARWDEFPVPTWLWESMGFVVRARFQPLIVDTRKKEVQPKTWCIDVGPAGKVPMLIGHLKSDRTLFVWPAAEAWLKSQPAEMSRVLQDAVNELTAMAQAYEILRS